MVKKIGNLIFERFELRQNKNIIFSQHPKIPLNQISTLQKIIKSQLKINERLINTLFSMYSLQSPNSIYTQSALGVLIEINEILALQIIFLKNKNITHIHSLVKQEIKLDSTFFSITHEFKFREHIDETELVHNLSLLTQLQSETKKIASHLGNTNFVQIHSQKIIDLTKQIKKTSLHNYVREDIEWIKNRAEIMIKNPKNNKVGYAFATFYIVSPGTFELTGVFLFFKYLGKYGIQTHKKLRRKP